MPEETQTDQNQSGVPFLENEVEVNEREPTIFGGSSSIVGAFRKYIPAVDVKGKSNDRVTEIWMRKKILEDQDFLNSIVSNMFIEAETDEISQYYRENPEEYTNDYIATKNDVYNLVAAEVMDGEDIGSAIKRRQTELMSVHAGHLNTDAIRNTVQSNPDTYKDLGIVDQDGNIGLNSQGLTQMYWNNDDFKNMLVEDNYNGFLQDLGTAHNTGAIDTNDINQMSSAYTVYRTFGKEGLTQFLNYMAHVDHSLPLEEQDQRAKEAISFMQSAKFDNQGIGDVIDEFFGSEESDIGRFVFTPAQESAEMEMNIPKDLNDFTALTKYNGQFQKDENKMVSFIEMLQSTSTEPVLSTMGYEIGYSYEVGEKPTAIGGFVNSLARLVDGEPDEPKYFQADAEMVFEDLTKGFLSHYTRNAVMDATRLADEGEKYTWDDLAKTLVSNSTPVEIDGRTQYIVDLNEADPTTVLATHAIRNKFGRMVKRYNEGENSYAFDPNFNEAWLDKKWKEATDKFNSRSVPIYDEENRIVGSRVERNDGFFGNIKQAFLWTLGDKGGQLVNGIADATLEALDSQVFRPMVDKGIRLAQDTGLEGWAEWKGAQYDEIAGQYLDQEIGGLIKRDDMLDSGARFVGQFGSYLYTSWAIGSWGIGQLGKMKKYTTFRDAFQAKTIEGALKMMRPSAGSKLANFAYSANRVGNGASNLARSGLKNVAKLEIGEILRQPITSQELSIFHMPTQFQESTKEGSPWSRNVSDAYYRSNRFTQVAFDMVGNGALALAFDGVLAGTRVLFNKGAIYTGIKKGGRGWKIKDGELEYLKSHDYTWNEGFNPDIRRFVGAVMKDAQELQEGSLIEASQKFAMNPAFAIRNPESVADISTKFYNEAGLYFDTLYEDVRSTLEMYDSAYMYGEITPSNVLNERARVITNNVLNNTGKQMADMFLEGDNPNFARTFIKHLREIGEYNKADFVNAPFRNRLDDTFDLETAVSLTNDIPYSSIVDTNLGDYYRIQKVKDSHWAEGLADIIEEHVALPNMEKRTSRFLRSLNFEPDETDAVRVEQAQEASEFFNNYVGKTYLDNDGNIVGEVVDLKVTGDNVLDESGNLRLPQSTKAVVYTDADEIIEVAVPNRQVNDNFVARVDEDELQAQTRRYEMEAKARKRLLKRNDRERWFERFQKQNKKYLAFKESEAIDEAAIQKKNETIKTLREEDEVYASKGISSQAEAYLREGAGYKTVRTSTVRKFLANLGSFDLYPDYSKFAKNVDKIKRYIPNREIPKNVVFTKVVNGKQETFLTIRKMPKDVPASLWMKTDEGTLKMNPYIRRIDKNVTVKDGNLTLYKPVTVDLNGVKIRMYRPLKGKETKGVALNIQKPIADDGSREITDAFIMNNNVDALAYDMPIGKVYRPIDEHAQVVELKKLKGSQPPRVDTSETLSIKELDETQRDELVNMIREQSELAKQFTRTNIFLGGTIGLGADIYNAYSNDEDFQFKYTYLGMAAQFAPKMLLKNFGNGSIARRGFNYVYDNWMMKFKKMEDADQITRELGPLGRDPFDSVKVSRARKYLKNTMDRADENPNEGITRSAVLNKHATSMFTRLSRLGSKRAQKFKQVLLGISDTTGEIAGDPVERYQYRILQQRINKVMKERGITDRAEAEKLVDVPNDYFTQVLRDIGPQRTRAIMDEVMGVSERNDDFVKRTFDSSLARLIESGAQDAKGIREGTAIIENKGVLDSYKTRGLGDQYRELDARLFEDPEIESMVRAVRDHMEYVETRYIDDLDKNYNEILNQPVSGIRDTYGEQYYSVMKKYYDDKKNPEEFVLAIKLDPNMSDRAKKDMIDNFEFIKKQTDIWNDLESLAISKRRFQSYKGQYLPQIQSTDAIARQKTAFQSEYGHLYKSSKELDDAFEDYRIGRRIEVNSESEQLNKIKHISKDVSESDEMYTKKYPSEEDARVRLVQIAHRFEQAGYPEDALRIEREGRVVQEAVGINKKTGTTKHDYYIEIPMELATKRVITDGKVNNIGPNAKIADEFYRNQKNQMTTASSNFLDNTRKGYMPYEFRELDLEQIIKTYSRDTGRRIHQLENNMMSARQLRTHYLNSIQQELQENFKGLDNEEVEGLVSDLTNIYEVAFGMLGRNRENLKALQRQAKWSNIYRNLSFLRYGYGFGMYNLFEWVVIGSQMSGGMGKMIKTFFDMRKGDSITTANLEAIMENERMFRRQVQFARPEYRQAGIYEYQMDDLVSETEHWLAKGVNKLGDFSLTNLALKPFGGKVSGGFRVLPIVGDSFLGSSMFASAITARATMGEVTHIAEAARLLRNTDFAEDQVRRVVFKGKAYTPAEITRKLELYGLPERDHDFFIENIDKFKKLIDEVDNDKNFNSKLVETREDAQMSQVVNMLTKVVRNSVESYNGTNKMFRPESWDSPVGKGVAMYSTYSNNVGFQILQRRIREPLKDWFKKYNKNMPRASKVASAMNMALAIRSGNTEHLIKGGMTREMIEEFPVEAVVNIGRAMTAVGISVAGYMSLDAVRDVVAITVNNMAGGDKEFDDFDSWTAVNRRMILNPFDEEDRQVTWEELFDDEIHAQEFTELLKAVLNQANLTGMFGRWGDPFTTGFGYGGMSGLSPLTSDIEGALQFGNKLINDNAHYIQDGLSDDVALTTTRLLPVVGSNVFSETRRDFRDYLRDSGGSSGSGYDRTADRSTDRGAGGRNERQ